MYIKDRIKWMYRKQINNTSTLKDRLSTTRKRTISPNLWRASINLKSVGKAPFLFKSFPNYGTLYNCGYVEMTSSD